MGYNSKSIDIGWWKDQIRAGEQFRKKYAKQERWQDWRSYYRGDWASDTLAVNFYFMLLRAVVPRIYFRNPAVSVIPTKPGPINALFAQIQERIDNKLIGSMKIKKQLKKMIQDTFMFGVGVGKLGFGAQHTPSPNIEGTSMPLIKGGRVEYRSGIITNMPWFSRVHTGNYIVPADCEDADDAMWEAHEVLRPYEDVRSDPRFKNRSKLNPVLYRDTQHYGATNSSVGQLVEMVRLYEIRDRKFGRVIVFPDDQNTILYNGPDELYTNDGSCLFPLVFNNDDEVFWGVPDSAILEPQQLEINEVRTQMMRHRRVTLVKLMAEEGIISDSESEKMISEDVLSVVKVKDINRIRPLQISDIPQGLYGMGEVVHSDMRESLGFSRNQFGEMQNKERTTATEASIVQMSTEIRVDERRDLLADLLVDVIGGMNNVIYKFWGPEQVTDVIGPGGIRVWVEFSGQMLRDGAYETKVDADTAMPQTRAAREQRAVQTYSIMKENPLIDPIKLTKYLLREMHGVQYDDLMRGLPEGAGMDRPMQVSDYGRMMENAKGQKRLNQGE